MKPKKINKKLELKKETIATLDSTSMAIPKGGIVPTKTDPCTDTCNTCNTCTTCTVTYTWAEMCTIPPVCNTYEDRCTTFCI